MKILLFLLLFFTSFRVIGQKPMLDSLWKRITSLTTKDNYEADTNYLNTLNILSDYYRRFDADSAIILAQESAKYASKYSYPAIEIEANRLTASSYVNQGKYAEALSILLTNLKRANQLQLVIHKGKILTTIGFVYNNMNQPSKAFAYYEEAISIYKKNKRDDLLGANYNSIAEALNKLQQYEKALKYYFLFLEITQKTKDIRGEATALNNIGSVYVKQKQTKQAMFFLIKAKPLAEQSKHQNLLSEVLQLLAECEIDNKNYLQALAYAQAALKISLSTKHKAKTKQNHYTLYLIYKLQNNTQQALYHHEQYKVYFDSLSNLEVERKTALLQASYEFGKREDSLQLIQKSKDLENQKQLEEQKYISYASGVGILFVVVIAFLIFNSRQKEKKSKEELSLKNKEINKQKEELKSTLDKLKDLEAYKEVMTGMIVHDLKNPLNSILSYSAKEENNNKKIFQIGQKMLSLIINILDIQKFESANMQLNITDLYLFDITQKAVEQVSLFAEEKKVQLQIDINPTIKIQTEEDILLRVFENLLSNAIKYTPMYGGILIGCEQIDAELFKVFVKDTGVGIPISKINLIFDKFSQVQAKKLGHTRSTGLGLAFCKMAIEAHGEKIWVESEEGRGSVFYFTLKGLISKDTSTLFDNKQQLLQIPTTKPLCIEDLQQLSTLKESLKSYTVYHSGIVHEIITAYKSQHTTSENVELWLKELETVLFNYDEKAYQQLINN